MSTVKKLSMTLAVAAALYLPISVRGHNVDPMPWIVPSTGVISAVAIVIDGSDADWPGSATSFTISDYGAMGGGIQPVSAAAKVLHKADGVYLFLTISDGGSVNQNDSVQVRFDVNHNGTLVAESTDWGVQVLRNGQATWGAADQLVGNWAAVPAGTVAVSAYGSNPWSVEMRIPTGAPTGIDLSTGVVGVHFMIYDVDQLLGLNNAKYTQWPAPSLTEMPGGIDALFDTNPSRWGNYQLDLATTFPDISLTEVRNVYDGPENYRKISHTANNVFQVTTNNPGGTAVPEPPNVRLNLYLAARGIGESWHRIDAESVLNSDCAAPTWPSTVVAKTDVCSGAVSLDDISSKSINDIVANTAKYTTKLGTPMTRLGGESISIPVGSTPIDVLEWNTTPAQDDRYTEVVVNGTTYRRQHQCMKAEAIVPGDPNPSNNIRQVNMDFVCVPGAQMKKFGFSAGWAGFFKYNPDEGKDMFLQLVTRNINPRHGWKFVLNGTKQINEQFWVARIRGKQSLPMELGVVAPREELLGRPIKRNLMVPPQAGGDQPNASKRSGIKPVYVKVRAGATIRIVSYEHAHNDTQSVDLDGEGKEFRSNGPAGYQPEKALKKFGGAKLIAPELPVGALIGSFDNFKGAFLVAEGAQVVVPRSATHLALGINDFAGMHKDNTGTGFRVKVTEVETDTKSALLEKAVDTVSSVLVPQAHAMGSFGPKPLIVKAISIQQVMPIVCVQGYEATGQTRVVGDGKRALYRFMGDVCWGLINVFDPELSNKQDQGDPFEERKSWWQRLFRD